MRVARSLPLTLALTALGGLAVPSIASADYSSAVIADGPLAYYRLNEPSGPVAADSSGSVPPAIGSFAAGGVTYAAPGPFSPGSGTGVTLTTGTVEGLLAGIAHTASLWVKPSTRTAQTLVEHGDPLADGWAIGIAPNSTPRGGKRKLFFQSHGLSVNSKISLASGSWSMVSVTWDTAKITFHVNGGAIKKTINTPEGWTAPGPAADPALTVGPGAGAGGTSFDEVALFPGVLTTGQIAAHFAATLLPTVLTPPVLGPLAGVREGDELTLTPGTYAGGLATTRTWQRCDQSAGCSIVTGVTGTAHRLAADDVDSTIQVEETAANVNGSVTIVSDATDPVLALPSVTPTGAGTTTADTTIATATSEATPVTAAEATVGGVPLACATRPQLAAAAARSARLGKARATLELTTGTRRVSLRAKRGTIRSVTFRLNGKRVKAPRNSPRTLTIRQAWMKPGKHTLKVTVKPRRGRSRTLTMRLVVGGC